MSGFIMVVLKKLLAVLLAVLTPPLTLLFGFEPTAKFDPACIEVMEKTDGSGNQQEYRFQLKQCAEDAFLHSVFRFCFILLGSFHL